MITIKIPFKTPTINHLHCYTRFGCYLKKEAKDLKNEIKEIIDNMKIKHDLIDMELNVVVEIHENWYCKDNSIKRKDLLNREKFLIDSVFEALGIDDKQIFKCTFIKMNDWTEYSIINISES